MKFILPMVVGAVIGYFTNWLAIKMLFRPYEEKFILGFKVPFTPGLIPKEQKRIARNIGMTVEDYLLSPEAIMDSFDSENMEVEIKKFIEDKLGEWDESDLRIEDLLSNISVENRKYIYRKVDELPDKILNEILKDKNRELLGKYIQNILENKDTSEDLGRWIEDLIKKYEDSGKLDSKIENIVVEFINRTSEDERLIEEIFPSKLEDDIRDYLDENQRIIGYRIRELISSKNIRVSLEKAINNMVESNVSSLITAFVPKESISEKIYEAIEKYIKSDKAITDINGLLKTLVRTGFDTKVSSMSKSIFSNMKEDRLIGNIRIMVKDNMDPERVGKLIESEYENLDKEYLASSINDIIFRKIESEKFKKDLRLSFNRFFIRVKDIKISDILYDVNLDGEKIYSILASIFNMSIKERLPELIGKLGIAKIVENTINKFEFDFVEKLILDIAAKELRAITNLGGVLGGVIGLLTPLLQML